MITELEQEFFKVFGIKPYCVRSCTACYLEQGIDAWEKFNCENTDCDKCEHDKSIWEYPEISDRVLLELICCVPKTVLNNCTTIKEIKEAVLKDLILRARKYTAQELKHQIQQLFKEEG